MGGIATTFKEAIGYLELGIEACAALIIAWAAIEAFAGSVRAVAGTQDPHARETIRLGLGRWLALALEFELAADILGTAVAPTWDEVGKVAAIIALRTALNFFLQREIRELARDRQDGRRGEPGPGAPGMK